MKAIDRSGLTGIVVVELVGCDGEIKDRRVIENLITRFGDQWYGERAASIGSNAVISGMRLGTGTTSVSKTGAGAAIVTYVSGSAVAIDGGFPTSALDGTERRITWKTTWNAGIATSNGIAEAVLSNENPLTDVAGVEGNTVSRVLLNPVVNKSAGDTLSISWIHALEAA